MARATRKTWNLCPSCHCLVYSVDGVGNHRCPAKVRARVDAELDIVLEEELSSWNKDVNQFWDENKTHFYEYLAEKKII